MEQRYTPDLATLRAPHDPHADASHAYVGWTIPSSKMPGTLCRMSGEISPDVLNKLDPPKRPFSIARESAKRKAASRAMDATEVAVMKNDICEMEERLKQLEVFNEFDIDGSGAQSVLCHCMQPSSV